MSDLLFRLPPGTTDLLFGEVENLPDIDASVAGVMPAMRGPVYAGRLYPATVAGTLATISGSIQARYVSGTDRPVVSRVEALHQDATRLEVGSASAYEEGAATVAGPASPWGPALRTHQSASMGHQDGARDRRVAVDARHQDAMPVPTAQVGMRYQDGLRDRRPTLRSRHQDAVALKTQRETYWQERYRDRRPNRVVPWGKGSRVHTRLTQGIQDGQALNLGREFVYEEAMRPPAGTSGRIIVVPPFDPCYLPDPNLLFSSYWGTQTTSLRFVCELHDDNPDLPTATVVVPIRSIYMQINSVSLRRVVGDVPLPTYSMTLSIDTDSWTWGFSASLWATSLEDVLADESGPVEVEANINGTLYRLIVESVSRDRTFNSSAIRIGGRGKSALLANPYSPILTFVNDDILTANQLMEDVLTLSGIPIGWAVDWGIEDWSVPIGAFNVRGTYIDGLQAIAAAAGAYLQPHATDETIRVLHRYPTNPWDWSGASPDFELPSSVTTRESIEWIELPSYNRVFVSGASQGIVAQVTKTGEAGDVVAPMVVDPLITAIPAGRQRGRAILGATGRKARVGLRLPVLTETGIITPGKMVRYTDGADVRIGIVRSTAVDVSMPEVWQSLSVETQL